MGRWTNKPSIETRFWQRVQKTETCWLWTGAIDHGYGLLWETTPNGPRRGHNVPAHRFSYQLHNGPIPNGLKLDHTCHNGTGCLHGDKCPHRRCVRPDHLEPATCRQNILRGESLPAQNARRRNCVHGHPLTGDNLLIEHGKRRCVKCKKRRIAAWKRQNRGHCNAYLRKWLAKKSVEVWGEKGARQ